MSGKKRLKWLPDGWIVKVAKKKTGGKVRFYSSPSSGHTFRSKLEVLRYLKVKKVAYQSHETMACLEDGSQHVVEQAKDTPTWLPAGWLVEIRTRRSGGKYKSYFNPSTGSRFYSKPGLFRHLNAGKSPNLAPKQRSSSNGKHTVIALASVDSSPDGLPSGWIKEIRYKQNASGLRKDPYYTDPVSGLVFRSKKEVFRYLETGEISKYAFSPRKRSIRATCPIANKSPPPIAAKELKCQGNTVNTVRRRLFSGQIPNSPGKMAEDVTQSVVEESCILLSNHAASQRVENSGPSCITLSDSERLGETIHVANRVNPACHRNELLEKMKEQSLEVLEKKLSEAANGNSDKWAEGQASRSNRCGVTNAKAAKMHAVPRRASKRLAGLEADSIADIEFSDFSLRTSKRAAKSKVTTSKSPLSNDGPGGSNCPINSEEPLEAPESSGKLKGEVIVEERAECVTSPFGDSWPDPCIEFAFKTLTGDIPVLEDTSVIQEYFQQLSSPRTPSHPDGHTAAAYGGPSEPTWQSGPARVDKEAPIATRE